MWFTCGLQMFPLNSAALENFFFLLGRRPQFNYNYAIRKAPLSDKKAQPLFSKNQMVAKNRQFLKQQTKLKDNKKRKRD